MSDEFKSVGPAASDPHSEPVWRGSATFRVVICSIIALIGVLMVACAAMSNLPIRYEWVAAWGFFFVLISVAGLAVEYVRGWRSREE